MGWRYPSYFLLRPRAPPLVLSPPCGMVTISPAPPKARAEHGGSKPTVWDGDTFPHKYLFNPSPPLFRAHRVGWRLQKEVVHIAMICFVLSPPCGMATWGTPLTSEGQRGHVLSPPCGMATLFNKLTDFLFFGFRAHRVGW